MKQQVCFSICLLALFTACGGQERTFSPALTSVGSRGVEASSRLSSKIQHVVIIFQENRTTDYLFSGLPGADTVRNGKNSDGRNIRLRMVPLTAPYDISHKHSAFKGEYANGKMNGFDRVVSVCKRRGICPPSGVRAYGYAPRAEVRPYFTMAMQYAFADRMFQTNEGPSFPAHQYILSGTSTIDNGSSLRAAENAYTTMRRVAGGCDSPPGSYVKLINFAGQENQKTYPCFDRTSLMGLIDAKPPLSWHYYEEHLGDGLWMAPDAISGVRYGPHYTTDVVAPPSQVLTDIAAGKLANVVWVTPTFDASDHAGLTDGTGPSWVASVVNTIGNSQYWNSTAIFVTWDDWGGWYDHVPPPQYNSYELGFRVPLIVISPYAKKGYVSHVQHEFGSILKFAEETFSLGSLGTTDVRSDNLGDCFDFNQAPRRFKQISAPHDARYFLRQAPTNISPDDDF